MGNQRFRPALGTGGEKRAGNQLTLPEGDGQEHGGMGNQHAGERECRHQERQGPLTSAAQERRQREAAAKRHQAAAGEQPPPFARKGTGTVSPPAIDPKTGLRDIVGTDVRQLTAAKVSRAETSQSNLKPFDDPTGKLRLEARCKMAGCLKTGTDHLSPLVVRRII